VPDSYKDFNGGPVRGYSSSLDEPIQRASWARMIACHLAEPSAFPNLRYVRIGHEDLFPPHRLNARCPFS
jgi:hypothetical protein